MQFVRKNYEAGWCRYFGRLKDAFQNSAGCLGHLILHLVAKLNDLVGVHQRFGRRGLYVLKKCCLRCLVVQDFIEPPINA